MSVNQNNGLRRYDTPILPPVFDLLPDEDKLVAIRKIYDSDLEIRRLLQEKIGKSGIAEHDLQVAINTINMLQDERKVFTHKTKGETGSGTYELSVRGGDTKFINTVALALIAVIAAIILLLTIT
jgi:hypothetical protein